VFSDEGATGATFAVAETTAFGAGSPLADFTLTADATHPAQNAILSVDGITIQRSTNTVSDVYSGVTMNLLSTTNSAVEVGVSRDSSELGTKLSELVTAYNNAISDFAILTGPVNAEDTTDVYSGSLQSNSTVSYVISSLKSMFLRDSSTKSGDISALRDLGITFQRDGTLAFDDTVLNDALETNPDAVVTMLTADRENKTYYGVSNRGFAGDAIKSLTDMIATTGQINTQTTSANVQLSKFKEQLATLEDRYNLILKRYITQFAAMDSYVGQVNSLKTSLTSTFAGMMAQYTNKN
jgi:flagellar hook-associated protein 2